MFKIECLKDYLTCDPKEYIVLATNIYMITDLICEDYPKYKEWYFTKQLPSISKNERNILFVRNPENLNEIVSMPCLKKNNEERKICTIYVLKSYRGLGIGTAMLEESLKWLGTTKPLITIADHKLDLFKPIIEKYDWELTEIVSGAYNERSKELCFNGVLKKEDVIDSENQLYRKLIKNLSNINDA